MPTLHGRGPARPQVPAAEGEVNQGPLPGSVMGASAQAVQGAAEGQRQGASAAASLTPLGQRRKGTREAGSGRRPGASAKPEHGLTLLELLVAVAIIGILAALAVPGLAAAKRAARKTACLNNLKQLQLCWHLYVTDHDDAVPPNRSLMTNGVWRSTPDSWIGFSSAPHDADTRAIEQGLLYRYDYNREVRIYHCPEDRSTVRGLTRPRTRSYSMNGAFGGRKEDKQPVVIQRAGEVRNPAQAFVFLDEHEDSIDDAHFLVWPAPDTRWVNVPADRHSRGGTFSFADGHVEHWKWQWPKSRRGWPTYYKEAENEADLADLQRLQAALPNAE